MKIEIKILIVKIDRNGNRIWSNNFWLIIGPPRIISQKEFK